MPGAYRHWIELRSRPVLTGADALEQLVTDVARRAVSLATMPPRSVMSARILASYILIVNVKLTATGPR